MPPLLRERQAALALIAFDLLREADDRQQEEEEEDMLLLVAMRHMNLLHTATAFAVKRAYTFRSPYYIKPRPSSFFENTVKPHYEEVDWLQHYRMHSATFYELLEGITPLLALQDTNFRQPVSAERRLSCALLYLASPVSMREVASWEGISQSTVCRAVHDVCNAIVQVFTPQYIKFPTTSDELKVAASDFLRIQGFPQVIGAIDGTHISIKPPAHSRDQYINRKKYASINVSAICDARGVFIDVYVG